MKIHLVSDLHTEKKMFDVPNNNADVCIIAGDLNLIKYETLYVFMLKEFKEKFNHVILVLGNHEFYGMNYSKGLTKIKQIADELDIHLLDIEFGTENLEIDDIKFWGSTLWTDFNKDNFHIKMKVKRGLNDCLMINGLNVNKIYDIHMESIKKINWNADIIISHHKPILRPHSIYNITDITYGFCCTDLEKRIEDSNVKHWFFGHTHDNNQYDIGETNIISNQLWYAESNKPYDPQFIIDI